MIGTIAGKELKSLFASPLAWMVLAVTQFIAAYVFLNLLEQYAQQQELFIRLNPSEVPTVTEGVVAPLLGIVTMMLTLAVPLLAMRMIAEERRNQTMVFLTSAPVSFTQIVLGKFVALVTFAAIIVLLVAAMPLALTGMARLDFAHFGVACAGLLLMVAGSAALSLYISSLTAHPMAAAFGSFAALLAMLLMGEPAREGLQAQGWRVPAALAQVFSPRANFEPLGNGLADTYSIACAVLLMILFLVLTVRRLDALRLRG